MNIAEFFHGNEGRAALSVPPPEIALVRKHRSWSSDVGFVLVEPEKLELACHRIRKVYEGFCSNPFESPTTDKVARLLKCNDKDVGAVTDIVVWVIQNVARSGHFAISRIRKLKESCRKVMRAFRRYKLYRVAMLAALFAKWQKSETNQRELSNRMAYIEELKRGRQAGSTVTVNTTQDIDSDFYLKWVPKETKVKVCQMMYDDRLKKWREAFRKWQTTHETVMAAFRAERTQLLIEHGKRKMMGTGGGDVQLHENISALEAKARASIPPKPTFLFRPIKITVDELIQICYQMQRITHLHKVFNRLGLPEQASAADTVNQTLSRRLSVLPSAMPSPDSLTIENLGNQLRRSSRAGSTASATSGGAKVNVPALGLASLGVPGKPTSEPGGLPSAASKSAKNVPKSAAASSSQAPGGFAYSAQWQAAGGGFPRDQQASSSFSDEDGVTSPITDPDSNAFGSFQSSDKDDEFSKTFSLTAPTGQSQLQPRKGSVAARGAASSVAISHEQMVAMRRMSASMNRQQTSGGVGGGVATGPALSVLPGTATVSMVLIGGSSSSSPTTIGSVVSFNSTRRQSVHSTDSPDSKTGPPPMLSARQRSGQRRNSSSASADAPPSAEQALRQANSITAEKVISMLQNSALESDQPLNDFAECLTHRGPRKGSTFNPAQYQKAGELKERPSMQFIKPMHISLEEQEAIVHSARESARMSDKPMVKVSPRQAPSMAVSTTEVKVVQSAMGGGIAIPSLTFGLPKTPQGSSRVSPRTTPTAKVSPRISPRKPGLQVSSATPGRDQQLSVLPELSISAPSPSNRARTQAKGKAPLVSESKDGIGSSGSSGMMIGPISKITSDGGSKIELKRQQSVGTNDDSEDERDSDESSSTRSDSQVESPTQDLQPLSEKPNDRNGRGYGNDIQKGKSDVGGSPFSFMDSPSFASRLPMSVFQTGLAPEPSSLPIESYREDETALTIVPACNLLFNTQRLIKTPESLVSSTKSSLRPMVNIPSIYPSKPRYSACIRRVPEPEILSRTTQRKNTLKKAVYPFDTIRLTKKKPQTPFTKWRPPALTSSFFGAYGD